MNLRWLSLIVCATGAGNYSWADAVGGNFNAVTIAATGPEAQAQGLRTCLLFVDVVTACGGPCNLFSLYDAVIATNDPQGFYQHSSGGDLAPNTALCPFLPLLCSDSFVTIGKADANGNTTAVDPSFDSSMFNPPPPQNMCVGGWFNSNPNNDHGVPDENGLVLVAQFTTRAGYNASGVVWAVFPPCCEFIPVAFECFPPCIADLSTDGVVNAVDLAVLLGAWGPNPGHAADLNDDEAVDAADLAILLGEWGPCP